MAVLLIPFGIANAGLAGCYDRNGKAASLQFWGSGSDVGCLANGCTFAQWSSGANAAICSATYRYSCYQVGTAYNKRWGITTRFPQSCTNASFPKGGTLYVGPVVK